MFYVYVLKSKKDFQLYIGSTNDLRKRLKEHMVKVIQKENPEGEANLPYGVGKELYQCEECGFHYVDKAMAEKCEA